MWYENINRNTFLLKLYDNVPTLVDVSIKKISIRYEGDRVRIHFDMPCFPDNPPEKWVKLGCNTAMVELDLFAIRELKVESGVEWLRGDIDIVSKEDMFIVDIKGTVKAHIVAENAMIQKIEGLITEDTNNE